MRSNQPITINLEQIYGKDKGNNARLDLMEDYLSQVRSLNIEGQEVVLTGAAPVWLYLKIAHGLHGKAKALFYDSPVTGRIAIFDHNPF